jgi:hypothetical protein
MCLLQPCYFAFARFLRMSREVVRNPSFEIRSANAESVFEKLWAPGFAKCAMSRAYIWDDGKFREITAEQVLRHRVLITASVSGPKCLIDIVIVNASGGHDSMMQLEQIHCYRAHVRF